VAKKEIEDDHALDHAAIRATDQEVLGQHIKDHEFQETPEDEVSPAVGAGPTVAAVIGVLVTAGVAVEAEAVVSHTAVHEDGLIADHHLAHLSVPTTETFKTVQIDHLQFLNSHRQISSLQSLH
jgi:hypothetical protein